jgi:hypothetical protein
MSLARCPKHHRRLLCPACIGEKGGRVKSEKKAKAAAKTGKLYGGRKRFGAIRKGEPA